MEFWPIIRKNLQGDLQHSKIRPEAIQQFDSDQPHSYYKIIKKYLDCIPDESGPFYRRTLVSKTGPRFSLQVVGVNILGNNLKDLFKDAGITDNRRITNHGLRVTSATSMFEAGLDT